MVVFLLTWLYIAFTFEVCPFFWDIIDNGIFDTPFFFYYSFFILFLLNYSVIIWKEFFNNNKDVIYNFFSLCLRPFSIFFTLFFAHLKRFSHFLVHFDYKNFIKITFDLFFKFFSNFFMIWRPLFRKWSYFGYFRTNRSKWWKNK
jgi:hypothetical protein